MSNKKISGLPFVGTMSGDEFWHIIQGVWDRRTSMGQFVEYLTPFSRVQPALASPQPPSPMQATYRCC